MTSAEELQDISIDKVSIVDRTTHEGGIVMTSELLEEPLQISLDMLPDVAQEGKAKKQKAANEDREAVMVAFP
eukprot:1506525-Lingulodinium_polyedra.AAC.1